MCAPTSHNSTIHSSQEVEATPVSINRQMDKVVVYTMEHYLALKRKEILTHATGWMNPEDIMLSELNQPPKDKYYMTPLI